MPTLSELRERLSQRLADSAHATWSTAALDEALRSALHDYSQALPMAAETVLSLPGPGREIALDGLPGLQSVTEVWWPYDSLMYGAWPPNWVVGFRLRWDDARPVLLLTTQYGEPRAGDELRLWYTRPHMIQDLDGGEFTSVLRAHESVLLTGAAGYAASAEQLDRAGQVRLDPAEAQTLAAWSAARLTEFSAWLAALKTAPGLSAPAYFPGFALDKWDE
jgi:hypothetical protein